MDHRTIARVAGLLGGLAWLGRLPVGAGTLDDVLHWLGLGLLAVAFAAVGAGLVSSSAGWLRALVAVALPLLVWSVLEVLHPAGSPEAIDAVLGAAVAVGAGVLLARGGAGGDDGPGRPRPERRSSGAHAR